MVTAPGLVFDMDDETYHGDPVPDGSLSSTFARLLTRHVPVKAKHLRENRKPTKSMNLGKAAHARALGAGPELIVWEHDGRTKAGKAEREAAAPLLATEAAVAVTEAERDQITGMSTALLSIPEVIDIIALSQPEVSGFWQEENGVWCRARYDLLSDVAAWDYKTCEDASLEGFSKAMASYGYNQQAEFYQRGLRALGHPAGERPMKFICQESTAPYLVQIHTPDELAIEAARLLNDHAIDVYATSKATDSWAGFDVLFAEPAPLPNYYFYKFEALLPDSWSNDRMEIA